MNTSASNKRRKTKAFLWFPAIAGAAFLAIVLVGVLPTYRDIESTQVNIEELQIDLERQKALLPIHLSLEVQKRKTLPEGIHVYERQAIDIEDLADLPDVFENLARQSGLELVSATPQVRSLRDGRELLRVDTRMRGELPTFNSLMNQLNKMRFVESIESMAIDVTNRGHEMSLSVWLAIQ